MAVVTAVEFLPGKAWHMKKEVVKLASQGTVFSSEIFSHIFTLTREHLIPSVSYEFKKLRFGPGPIEKMFRTILKVVFNKSHKKPCFLTTFIDMSWRN